MQTQNLNNTCRKFTHYWDKLFFNSAVKRFFMKGTKFQIKLLQVES